MSKPFIIGVCEHEIVDALRRVDVIDTWAEAFTPEGFVDAIESKAVPLGAEHTIILISDAHAKADYHPMINAYPGQIVAIPWEYEAPSTCPVVALPVTVNSILKALSLVVHSDLGLVAHGDEPIFVRGLQEHGLRKDSFPSIFVDAARVEDTSDDINENAFNAAISARTKLEALLAKADASSAPPEFYTPYDQMINDQASRGSTPTPTYPPPTSTPMPAPTPAPTYPPPTSTPMPAPTPTPTYPPPTSTPTFLPNAPDQDGLVSLAPTQLDAMWRKSQFAMPSAVLATFWSSKGGVGKSTFALNSAIWLATHSSLRVCIIDLDIEGDIANRLHLRTKTSLTDILAGKIDAVTLTDTVPIATVGRNNSPLYVIKAPSTRHGVNASLLMTTENYRRLVDVAKKVYNVIIIDAPAGLGMTAVSQFAIPSADKLIMVIDNEMSAVSQFIAEVKSLVSSPFNINPAKIGIVLNQVVASGVNKGAIETTLGKIQRPGGGDFRIIASAGDFREAVVKSYQRGAHIALGGGDLERCTESVASFLVDPTWLAMAGEKSVNTLRTRSRGSLLEKYLPHVYEKINRSRH